MPRRMSTLTRSYVYAFLLLRDGPDCQRCHAKPSTPTGHDVDHSDNDATNWDPSNLQLLCRSCNVAKENARRATPTAPLHSMADSTPGDFKGEKERETRNRAVGTEVAREVVDYQMGSPEMRANDLYEAPYRAWVINQVKLKQGITVLEAVNSGAEVVGCATTTASRYLAKLTSSAGPLQETLDMLHSRVITMKPIPAPRPTPPPTPLTYNPIEEGP